VIDSAFAEIAGEGVVLRRFRAADAPALAAYRSDPEVARYQAYEGCTLEQAEQLVAGWRAGAPGTPGAWFQFAVSLDARGGLLGDCALHCHSEDPHVAELGFSFARSNQGKGLATAAVRALLGYGFTTLALRRVIAVVDERNARARRLLLRTGFRLEGPFAEQDALAGGTSRELLYVLERERP